MNTWLQFLEENGAQLQTEGVPTVAGFSSPEPTDTDAFVSPLVEYGLIAVSGDDAASFLHNQLTNDVEHLSGGEARLAGYCSPKGRLLATLLIWKTGGNVMLMLPRDILPVVQKRLQMFVLRAKAKLADVSEQNVILGLVGDAASRELAAHFPALPAAPYAKVDGETGTLIRVADASGMPRHLWVSNLEAARQVWTALSKNVHPAGANAWKRTDIRAGVPMVTQATQEKFVPQMVNFDAIGGVNFKKGCYPGQEIVARTHYLGKVKRRMLLASSEANALIAGTELFSSAEPDQPCGMIVNAARNPQGGSDCLVEIKMALANDGSIHAGAPDGPLLRFAPLPYALPDE